MPQSRAMHQTTIRFGSELWSELEAASVLAGTSVAQYVREAAIMRLTRAESLAAPARAERVRRARANSETLVEGSTALAAESKLANARAQRLRDTAADTRRS